MLAICGKIFEIIIFNPIFTFLDENGFLYPNQSELCPLDSCKNRLLSIVHDTYANVGQHPALEVRASSLDISKAFDRACHGGYYSFEGIGMSTNRLTLLRSFLSDRFQRVVLNGKCSSWSSVLAGDPQCSIFDHYFFLYT